MGAMLTPRPHRRSTFAASRSDLFTKYQGARIASNRARRFIETECLVPEGTGLGQPYRLRPTHRRWLRRALDHEKLTVVISGPRGMGKTGWMAAVGVWALYDRPGAQVLFISTSGRTAQIAYQRAVRIIETSDRLRKQAMVYRNKADPWTELPLRGSVMRPLPAEEKYIVGQAPTIVLLDEIGYVSHDVLEAMQTSLGKTPGSVLIAFGTPGLGVVDSDSTPNQMWQLRQLARSESPPPDLEYIEHAAQPGADPAAIATWRQAYGELLDDLTSSRAVAHDFATLPPSRFGQMRLGLWTDHENAWMPRSAWEALTIDDRPLEPGAIISLGFDGSVGGHLGNDSTALVAYEVASSRLVVLGHWKGEIRRQDVLDTIEQAFTRYSVQRMYADPPWWRSELQQLAEQLGDDLVIEWNTASAPRMGPASDAFLAAVLKRELQHDGHQALRAHVLNAVAKRTAAGDVVTRDARRPRDTDLAIAAILAYEAARTWTEPPTPAIW